MLEKQLQKRFCHNMQKFLQSKTPRFDTLAETNHEKQFFKAEDLMSPDTIGKQLSYCHCFKLDGLEGFS